jgi:GGDEF-like domain
MGCDSSLQVAVLSRIDLMPPDGVYAAAVAALRGRAAEVVQGIEDSALEAKASPVMGSNAGSLRESRTTAIAAIVDYCLNAIESGGDWAPIPQAVIAYVCEAASIGMWPGVLVRGCVAGQRQFVRFVQEEMERAGFTNDDTALKQLCETYSPLWEHIVVSIEQVFEQERERLTYSPEARRARLVRRLLVEDLPLARLNELDYEVEAYWHLGLVMAEDDSSEVLLRCLRNTFSGTLLCIQAGDGSVWAWLSQRNELTFAQSMLILLIAGGGTVPLAVGEPRYGLDGWRQAHREAQIAWVVTRQKLCGPTRCADVLPVAGAIQSQAIAEMYRNIYILPLSGLSNGGHAIRKSLLAYVKHGRSSSSAGKAIGVTGRTIENHLKEARKVLGTPLNFTSLEIALTLDELGYMGEVSTESPKLGHASQIGNLGVATQ